ncbi:MAG TPA: ATP-dependent helicase, partial [Bacteroidetes bacterium]|nr:ATP-dependent helicase [Bacteroidota bacterium]
MQKSDIEKIIDHLKLIVPYESIHIENINPQSAVFDECKKHINPVFYNYFESKNIIDLYVHQVEVINEIFKKKNVIIVSKTASGKTLCFNIPVVNQILSDISATALYLFPTKALAQDQYKTLSEMLLVTNQNIVCNIYDGDTPKDNRIKIRNQSNIILSNPDMLHYAILPYHTHWHRFFKNIKFLVLDEVHAYRGIFGSHVGLLIRRFMRICKHYGSVPQIICASATIANAKSHAEKLTDSPFTLVEKDGAPRGKKQFLIWNPPIISMGNRKIRKASQEIGIQILGILLEKRLKTICFARSRSSVEVISSTLKQIYDTDKDRIAAYRGGYLPLERREIERNLFEGQTDIVISTNALELGIDIGAL